MGNDLQRKEPSQQLYHNQYNVLYSAQLGQVVRCSQSGELLFHRELHFGNAQSLEETELIIHKFMQEQQQSREVVLPLISFQKEFEKKMCNTQFKLHLFFDYSDLTLADEVTARVADNMHYFDFEDCWRMVYYSLKALAISEGMVERYPVLVKNSTSNRVFVHPGRIYLMPDGQLKLINPLMVSPYDRYQHRSTCYYSPEKLLDFDFNEDSKSVIFELGMTLLHVLTLQDCQSCYNGFQVRQDSINDKIMEIWYRYQSSLLCELLTKMTRTVRSGRAGLDECQQLAIQLYEQYEQDGRSGMREISHTRSEEMVKQEPNMERRISSSGILYHNEGYRPSESTGQQNIASGINSRSSGLTSQDKENISSNVRISNISAENKLGSCLIVNPLRDSNHNPLMGFESLFGGISKSGMKMSDSFRYGNPLSEGLLMPPHKLTIPTKQESPLSQKYQESMIEQQAAQQSKFPRSRVQFNKKKPTAEQNRQHYPLSSPSPLSLKYKQQPNKPSLLDRHSRHRAPLLMLDEADQFNQVKLDREAYCMDNRVSGYSCESEEGSWAN